MTEERETENAEETETERVAGTEPNEGAWSPTGAEEGGEGTGAGDEPGTADEPVSPEGDEDLPGGSAPAGAQTRPEAQEGFGEAGAGEAQSEDPPLDPEMVDDE